MPCKTNDMAAPWLSTCGDSLRRFGCFERKCKTHLLLSVSKLNEQCSLRWKASNSVIPTYSTPDNNFSSLKTRRRFFFFLDIFQLCTGIKETNNRNTTDHVYLKCTLLWIDLISFWSRLHVIYPADTPGYSTRNRNALLVKERHLDYTAYPPWPEFG